MSIRYVERAIWAKGIGHTRKAVLIAIADAVSDSGIGWLLISSLVKKTDLSERTVQSVIADLCDTQGGTVQPILERKVRSSRSSIFRVHLDRIPQHDHRLSEKEMTAEEMWGGAGDAPHMAGGGAGLAPPPRRTRTPPPQDSHPEPSLEPSLEPNPPLPSGEPPHGDRIDLLGKFESVDLRSVSLVDYVVDGWKRLTADHPRIQAIRAVNESRKKKIGARASEVIRAAGGGLTGRDVWDQIFAAIRGSEFLRGDAEPGRGYSKPFSLSVDKILEPAFFLQTLERAVTDADHAAATSDPVTGRRYGPAEQAGRDVLQRFLAARAGGG